ncbi:MAG: FAD-dependent oxidoreductase [Pseudomonadota bacterium]
MIIESFGIMGGLGFLVSLILATASKLFYVKEDPRLDRLVEALPGTNCGGCGFAGCREAAKGMLEKRTEITVCVNAGTETVDALARILDQESGAREPARAQVSCTGGGRSLRRYAYDGIKDCRAEALLYGGSMSCSRGCLGYGSCIRACPFRAIHMGKLGIPEISTQLCRGCGRCIRVCPHGAILVLGLSSRLLRLMRQDDCLAPCQQKCPAQIDIPRVIRQVLENDFTGALKTLKDRNPLVLTVGRVCAHPCETICRRNIADEGLSIGRLERFIGEWEMDSGRHVDLDCAPDTGFRVAVVGSGPAGLSCAYFLRRLGHSPTIFEARHEPGGMLRYGLPEYRLPTPVVDWEIQGILRLGITVRTGMALGSDFSLQDLTNQGYQAIFLGLGAWVTPQLCIEGEYVDGVVGSLDFLARAGVDISTLAGVPVAVVGESNTAMDCARTCIRLRAQSVTVLCPCDLKSMSARKRDVERAMEEGVSIEFQAVPVRVLTDFDGNATDLEYVRTEALDKTQARTGMGKKIPGSETVLKAGLIIAAFERKPDLHYLIAEAREYGFKATRQGTLDADRDTLMASPAGVFTAGDLFTGRSTVINAVADGRRAARSIHYHLTRNTIPIPSNLHRKLNTDCIIKDVRVSEHIPRVTVEEVPANIRILSLDQDIIGTITKAQAVQEARRCLRCGTTCFDR